MLSLPPKSQEEVDKILGNFFDWLQLVRVCWVASYFLASDM